MIEAQCSGTPPHLALNLRDVVTAPPLLRFIWQRARSAAFRIAAASLDPTFLMADAEIIATYELYNINRVKLENLIHRVFDPAQLEIEIRDRFGNLVKPREWFLVPLFVVNEVVERIRDGSITGYVYDPKAPRSVKAAS